MPIAKELHPYYGRTWREYRAALIRTHGSCCSECKREVSAYLLNLAHLAHDQKTSGRVSSRGSKRKCSMASFGSHSESGINISALPRLTPGLEVSEDEAAHLFVSHVRSLPSSGFPILTATPLRHKTDNSE
jgi:hypothetical protein